MIEPITNDQAALSEKVTEDPELTSIEKDTIIEFAKSETVARIFTAEAEIMRRLLVHPTAEVFAITILDGDTRLSILVEGYGGEPIVGLIADIPLGALQIRLASGENLDHTEMVPDRVDPRYETEVIE